VTGPRGGRGQAFGLAVPLLFFTTAAAWGQVGWVNDRLHWWNAFSWLFAAMLESTSLWVNYQSYLRLMANESAAGLRLASYGIAALVGSLNYDHFAPSWRPNIVAVVFASLSMGSPWLWGIYAKTRSRPLRRQLGLMDARSVHFAPVRWVWHPYRTAIVWWHATWAGESNPDRALARFTPPTGGTR
jgi:hypothetical protein